MKLNFSYQLLIKEPEHNFDKTGVLKIEFSIVLLYLINSPQTGNNIILIYYKTWHYTTTPLHLIER